MSGLGRRLVFGVALVSGAALLVVGFARSTVDAGTAGDRLVTAATPVLTDAGLQQLRTELTDLIDVGDAFATSGVSTLARLSGQDEPAFMAVLEDTTPAVVEGLRQLPAIEKQADGIVTNLERRQGQFESAAALPGAGLTLEQGALAGLALGALLVVVGLVGLLLPRRSLAIALLATGVAMVVGPLALGFPTKTADTDALLDSLRPFSVEKVEARRTSLATVTALLDGLDNRVVPAVAQSANTTPDAVRAALADADPDLSAAALARADEAMDHFAFLVRFSGTIQPLLVQTTELPARASMWMMVLPGAALTAAGVVSLAAWRSRRPEDSPHADA
ncbi:MAG: hypothetical protein QOG87_243 [Actinomycetota bacterium]|jgi:hypothetical protein